MKTKHLVRLYWGENYADKPLVVKKAIQQALGLAEKYINLYPGNLGDKTKDMLAAKYQVLPEQVLLSNGVESLVGHIISAFLKEGDEILTLAPTFVGYEHAALAYGVMVKKIPVGLTTVLSLEDFSKAITSSTKALFLAFPNTTTGFYHCSVKTLDALLSQWKGLVVIDECYFGIGKESVLPLLKKYKNLLILKSVSKSWGLAGIRVGWCISTKENIQILSKKTLEIAMDPVSLPSHLILQAVLPHTKLLEDSFIQHKAEFSKKLQEIAGLTVGHSNTTFVPVQCSLMAVPILLKQLEKKGIKLKDTSSLDYILFGIPPKNEWEYVITNFKEILGRV